MRLHGRVCGGAVVLGRWCGRDDGFFGAKRGGGGKAREILGDCTRCLRGSIANELSGLYTDESPGLKVDPVVVLVLSLVFIFSVVALHSKLTTTCLSPSFIPFAMLNWYIVIAKITRKFSS
jgi:hypothetical protein